jgi:hypothetical protein
MPMKRHLVRQLIPSISREVNFAADFVEAFHYIILSLWIVRLATNCFNPMFTSRNYIN